MPDIMYLICICFVSSMIELTLVLASMPMYALKDPLSVVYLRVRILLRVDPWVAGTDLRVRFFVRVISARVWVLTLN